MENPDPVLRVRRHPLALPDVSQRRGDKGGVAGEFECVDWYFCKKSLSTVNRLGLDPIPPASPAGAPLLGRPPNLRCSQSYFPVASPRGAMDRT